jgi:hypothetical protein
VKGKVMRGDFQGVKVGQHLQALRVKGGLPDHVVGTLDQAVGALDQAVRTLDRVVGALDRVVGTLDQAVGTLDQVRGEEIQGNPETLEVPEITTK